MSAKKPNFQYNELRYTDHATMRMFERDIAEADVEAIVLNGEIIEQYLDDKPFPSYLILGMVKKRPLHLVVAVDVAQQRCFVITLYEPNLSKFEEDFKTRRKQ